MKITAVVSAGNLCMRQHFFPVEKNRSCKHDHNTSRMCPRSAIFWDIFFQEKGLFVFWQWSAVDSIRLCRGDCLRFATNWRKLKVVPRRSETESGRTCLRDFWTAIFFCFCRKMHVQLHTDVFLLAQKANAQRESFPRTCNHPAPTNTSVHHTSTQIHILADDGSFWNAGTHPKTFKTLKVK